MTKEILARANALNDKIINLETYLNDYAIPSASCHRIKLTLYKLKRILRASNFMGYREYELDVEEFNIVNEALQKQLEKYKEEFNNLMEVNNV